MNTRFPVLSFISSLLRLIGWMAVLIGAAYGGYQGIIEPNQPSHAFTPSDLMELGGGVAAIVVGLIIAATGESIGVLFAIEENTRKTAYSISNQNNAE